MLSPLESWKIHFLQVVTKGMGICVSIDMKSIMLGCTLDALIYGTNTKMQLCNGRQHTNYELPPNVLPPIDLIMDIIE